MASEWCCEGDLLLEDNEKPAAHGVNRQNHRLLRGYQGV